MDSLINVTQDEVEIATDAYLAAKDCGATAEDAIKAGIKAVNDHRNRAVSMPEAVKQIDMLTNALRTIRVMHRQVQTSGMCGNCLQPIPCPTLRATNVVKEILK